MSLFPFLGRLQLLCLGGSNNFKEGLLGLSSVHRTQAAGPTVQGRATGKRTGTQSSRGFPASLLTSDSEEYALKHAQVLFPLNGSFMWALLERVVVFSRGPARLDLVVN